MGKKHPPDHSICRNKKAGFKFEILECLECGIILRGGEVKSLREGKASLDEAYARIEGDELWLIGLHINPYVYDTAGPLDPTRRRKLLIHASELRKLRPKVEQKGLTLVPTRMYFNQRGIAKVEIGLARGKSRSDKRQTIKEREHRREMDRATRRHR